VNLAYFFIEFVIAISIGSVSLFANSMDFLEDVSIKLLVFTGIGWSAGERTRLGMLSAASLLVPVSPPCGPDETRSGIHPLRLSFS
jgi:Co/Zn/Cd efflux system component